MRLFGKRNEERRPRYEGPIEVDAIGFVENKRVRPQPHDWEGVESAIHINEEHRAKVEGIGGYSHVIVVFYMDMARDAPEKPERLTLASGNEYGILATRSQLRPNHLGVSVAPLLGVEEGVLRVRGLDAIDGTAILDIKPYLPEYDSVPGATIPRG